MKKHNSHARRFCFMGNCQAMFIQELELFKNYPTKLYRLTCPVINDRGTFAEVKKNTIENFFSSESMTFMQKSNDFSIQPSISEIRRFAPTHFILTLFDPLCCFIHKRDGYIISLRDPNATGPFHAWVHENFRRMNCNISNYLSQFGGMIRTLKKHFPDCPICVVSRMTHFNFDRAKILEAFIGWEDIADQQADWMNKQAAKDRVSVIDLERIAAGIVSTGSFERAFPYIEVIARSNIAHTEICFYRDLEHFSHDVATRVAKAILQLADGKSPRYSKTEQVPEQWRSHQATRNANTEPEDPAKALLEIEGHFDSPSFVRQTLAIYSLLRFPKELAVAVLLRNASKISLWCNTVKALYIFCTAFSDERLVEALQPILQKLQRMCRNNDYHANHRDLIAKAIAWQQHKVPQRMFLSDAPMDRKPAYIWGTGTKGKLLLKQMRRFGDHKRVKGYISSGATCATPYHGSYVYPPADILGSDSIIIIASAFEGQIRESFDQAKCKATIYSCDDVFYFYNMLSGNWFVDA